MLYVKAAMLGLLVFLTTEVVMFWNLFMPLRNHRATGISALQSYAWRAVPVGLALFIATVAVVVLFSYRHAH